MVASSSIERGPRYDSGDGMGIEQSVIATILQTTEKILLSWIPQEEFLIQRPLLEVAKS
jgi:hypothetical protein